MPVLLKPVTSGSIPPPSCTLRTPQLRLAAGAYCKLTMPLLNCPADWNGWVFRDNPLPNASTSLCKNRDGIVKPSFLARSKLDRSTLNRRGKVGGLRALSSLDVSAGKLAPQSSLCDIARSPSITDTSVIENFRFPTLRAVCMFPICSLKWSSFIAQVTGKTAFSPKRAGGDSWRTRLSRASVRFHPMDSVNRVNLTPPVARG